MEIGLSIIIKNEYEFNRVKEFLGTKNLYLNYVPQMATTETAIVVYANADSDFSTGSIGSSEYQKSEGLRLVQFNEYFKNNIKEYILCAANRYDDGKKHEHQPININRGFVVCGRRHHNCIGTFAQIVGFPYTELGHRIHNTEVQGFLTNTNRFVTRKEAYKIAFDADQIKGPNKGYSENEIGLTSEDLYY